jgi:hypothetical protein
MSTGSCIRNRDRIGSENMSTSSSRCIETIIFEKPHV